jgi:hypothetical protein
VQARKLQAERLRLITNRFRVGEISDSVGPDPPSAAAASIQMQCTQGHMAGTFAAAVNALVFRRLEQRPDAITHCVNLKYVSSYECHDKRYGVFTCYGVMEPGGPTVPEPVIERITIRPVSGHDAWRQYLERLADFLNQDPNNRTRIYRIDPEETVPSELVLKWIEGKPPAAEPAIDNIPSATQGDVETV